MEYKRHGTAESPATAGTTATSVETADGRYAPSHRAAEGWTIGRAEASTRRLGRRRKLWYGLLARVGMSGKLLPAARLLSVASA